MEQIYINHTQTQSGKKFADGEEDHPAVRNSIEFAYNKVFGIYIRVLDIYVCT